MLVIGQNRVDTRIANSEACRIGRTVVALLPLHLHFQFSLRYSNFHFDIHTTAESRTHPHVEDKAGNMAASSNEWDMQAKKQSLGTKGIESDHAQGEAS